jgi:hypothetical protein
MGVVGDTSSREALLWFYQHMQAYLGSQEECSSNRKISLPKRVLDLGTVGSDAELNPPEN